MDEGEDNHNDYEEILIEAIKTFRALNGNVCCMPTFIVPANNLRWPMRTWGYPLGETIAKFLNLDFMPELREKMLEMNLLAPESKGKGTTYNGPTVLLALDTFVKYNGGTMVPKDFIVPSTPEWPEPTWGMNLELKLNNIKRTRPVKLRYV